MSVENCHLHTSGSSVYMSCVFMSNSDLLQSDSLSVSRRMNKTVSLICREFVIKASFSSDTDNFNHLEHTHTSHARAHAHKRGPRLFINPALIRKVSPLRQPDTSNINFCCIFQVLKPLSVHAGWQQLAFLTLFVAINKTNKALM